MYTLASIGLATPPCGVPQWRSFPPVNRRFPFSSRSSTGACSHILIRRSTSRSTIRRATHCRSSQCGISSPKNRPFFRMPWGMHPHQGPSYNPLDATCPLVQEHYSASTSRFSSGGRPIASAAWSHDGAGLVYRSNRNGSGNQLVRRSASGGGREELLLTFETERAAQIRAP